MSKKDPRSKPTVRLQEGATINKIVGIGRMGASVPKTQPITNQSPQSAPAKDNQAKEDGKK